MLLPMFEYYEPATVTEACQLMTEHVRKARVLAGGTDLLVNMKKKLAAPQNVVSVMRIEEMKKLDFSSGVLTLGACVTVAEIAASKTIESRWSALCSGARALGSPQIRNRATIGGNLSTASSAADLPPSLIAYGARVTLRSKLAVRTVSLDNFFLGSKLTETAPDEIMTEIQIDEPPPYSGAGYLSLGIRNSQDIKIVNVASFFALDHPGGVIKNARIVMGCVGPTHLRAVAAEKILLGEKPSEAIFAKAGRQAMQDASPRGAAFSRASAEYKRDMVETLTKRTLSIAWQEIQGQSAFGR